MKYILVSGGVISGIGKGIVSSSIGLLLKARGLKVTSIKIDPYINIDAGTFSPYEHGEVFVLDDGGEVDLDLGNYERFLDITLHKDNNITTGKIYQDVIAKERKGEYLGKTVQVVPHVTNAIQEWVVRVAKVPVDDSAQEPDVCIIELGGTIGDIESMPFLEAFRQFQFNVGADNFCCSLVSLVPQTKDEQKTKPTQKSVREFMGLGLSPNLIFCRSKSKLCESTSAKISSFCHVRPNQVISVPDVSSIYCVPLLLEEQQVPQLILDKLKFSTDLHASPQQLLNKWSDLAYRFDNSKREVTVCLVGKYTRMEDAYASLIKALKHAAMFTDQKLILKNVEAEELEEEMKLKDPVKYHKAWQTLCSTSGVLIPGGFGERGFEGKIQATKWARINKKPFLGICLGLQCAVIEYARNVLNLQDAHSTEMSPNTSHPLVVDMPEHNPGQMGGTMRLGKRRTIFQPQTTSIIRKLYRNAEYVDERHRHRYEVNPEYVDRLEEAGLIFVGRDETGKRMEILELNDHPYFVGVQYHPEYQTRPLRPSQPFLGLILASSNQLSNYLAQGCRLSPIVAGDYTSYHGDSAPEKFTDEDD